jgi:hypothetical protein
MTTINFNEPSEGDVTNNDKAALTVRNNGIGGKSAGIKASSKESNAVWGISITEKGTGVFGEALDVDGGTGVRGTSKKGIGVHGKSEKFVGVKGEAKSNKDASGVYGVCNGDKSVNGVKGESTGGIGVLGQSDTVAIWGRAPIAGFFEGEVHVTGDIKLVNAADCAEDFDVDDLELKNVEAGTVMVLTENGSLQSSYQEYDKKVAGIVSGARGYKPGIILDRQQIQEQSQNKNKDRLPIALMGKVYCKVDARHSSIEIGDLLTTSSMKGYAMKAEDPLKAFGAVIGKALGSIKEGLGMIPVLVALQ